MDEEVQESIERAVRFLNLLIVTERGTNDSRDDQYELFMEEFKDNQTLFATAMDVLMNFVVNIALTISFSNGEITTPDQLLTTFRDGIVDSMNQ